MARELGRPLTVTDVRAAAAGAIAEVFGLELVETPLEAVAERVSGAASPRGTA
jgi:hypothetical protein